MVIIVVLININSCNSINNNWIIEVILIIIINR